MLYNRTEDENHIDSERVGLSRGSIADTLREGSYDDHQKVQWDPVSPENERKEKVIDGDEGLPTLKIKVNQGRKRTGS